MTARHSFTPVDPYDYSRLYGREKYNLQNMLLKQVNMPAWSEPGDVINELWSDRFITEWQLASKLVESAANGDAFFAEATDESFLKFAAKVVALLSNGEKFWTRYKELIAQKPLPEDAYAEICKRNDAAYQQAASEIEPAEITGAVLIRYTNASSGYPCLRLSTIKASTEGRVIGVPICKRQRQIDIYGEW